MIRSTRSTFRTSRDLQVARVAELKAEWLDALAVARGEHARYMDALRMLDAGPWSCGHYDGQDCDEYCAW